jgi:hypothetical protein
MLASNDCRGYPFRAASTCPNMGKPDGAISLLDSNVCYRRSKHSSTVCRKRRDLNEHCDVQSAEWRNDVHRKLPGVR